MLVAVTGADGFIGSHLVEHLLNEGMDVRALVQYNSFDGCGWLGDVKNDVEIFYGDVRDQLQMIKFVRGAHVVYNLAALISVPYSFLCADQFLETNVRGTLNILEACGGCSAKLVHVSTSEVYGSAQFTPMTEEHPINPRSPYAASKAAADSFVMAYHRSFGIPVTIVRPFNTFGPRQSQRAVIPRMIAQCLSARTAGTPVVLGDLRPRRDFTYVRDTVEGIALARGCKGTGPFNLGTGVSFSIMEVLRAVAGIVGIKNAEDLLINNQDLRPQDAEVECLISDPTLYWKCTGWASLFPFEKGLNRTVEWFEDHNVLPTKGLV